MTQSDTRKGISLCLRLIDKLELDLKNLNIATECASNAYIFTPVLAALAGAKVYAVGKDSKYGTFLKNKSVLKELSQEVGIQDSLNIYKNVLPNNLWERFDVITNSGFLRPINESQISKLKSTAMISLMWETWEFRSEDIDIHSCQKYKIPVIGTNEGFPSINMFGYNGYIALKLLLELGIEIHNNSIVLIGGGKTGEAIAQCFEKLNLHFFWYTSSGKERKTNCFCYEDLSRIFESDIDAIICAEHTDQRLLFGEGGFVSFKEVKAKFPEIKWGHICGNINIKELGLSNIEYFPKTIRPPKYMSYQAFDLGIRPVIELNAAGLKVGEIYERAIISSNSVEESIQKTIDYGIGQDFEGGFYKFNP